MPTLIEGSVETDRSEQARQHALEWAYRNQGRFCGPAKEPKGPANGWLGRWDDAWIGFFKNNLREELSRCGYDARSVMRQWHERGWLVCDEGRRTYQVKADGNYVRLVALIPGEVERQDAQITKKDGVATETVHTHNRGLARAHETYTYNGDSGDSGDLDDEIETASTKDTDEVPF
jgi:hypothetical protein